MANLDTAAKRNSGINTDCAWRKEPPLPTGTIGQGPRQASALQYSGILASAPASSTAVIRKTRALDGTGVGKRQLIQG